MRTIRFRGKCLGTGEWIYGSLLQEKINGATTECIIVDLGYARDRKQIQVNTAGQFTGLLDGDGNEIYEGDILGIQNDPYFLPEIVIYAEGCFMAKDDYTTIPISAVDTHCRTVVGNIHDNPELCQLPR